MIVVDCHSGELARLESQPDTWVGLAGYPADTFAADACSVAVDFRICILVGTAERYPRIVVGDYLGIHATTAVAVGYRSERLEATVHSRSILEADCCCLDAPIEAVDFPCKPPVVDYPADCPQRILANLDYLDYPPSTVDYRPSLIELVDYPAENLETVDYFRQNSLATADCPKSIPAVCCPVCTRSSVVRFLSALRLAVYLAPFVAKVTFDFLVLAAGTQA